jgi:hypothetical protein
MGIWHSHGRGGVHHSLVDDEMMGRILPAMAEENYRRPCDALLTPLVRAPDEAELPQEDGTIHQFTLLGPALPGSDGRQRIRWKTIDTRFRDRPVRPRAVVSPAYLHLSGGQVVLTLGLPAGATLESQVVDRAFVRTADLYSLVVNAAGETYVNVLTMHDIGGRTVFEQNTCSIQFTGDDSSGPVAACIPAGEGCSEASRECRCDDPHGRSASIIGVKYNHDSN